MVTALPPMGPGLARANRRILAERQGWPDGAIEECEHLEEARPGWWVTWRSANTVRGFEAPAGFYARERPPLAGRHPQEAHAPTAERLGELLFTETTP